MAEYNDLLAGRTVGIRRVELRHPFIREFTVIEYEGDCEKGRRNYTTYRWARKRYNDLVERYSEVK